MEDPVKQQSTNFPPLQKGRLSLAPLLDLEFKKFITPSLLKIIYVLSLLMVLIGTLNWVFTSAGFGSFLFRLISAPFLLLFGTLIVRIGVELVMTAFKLLETQQKIEKHLNDKTPEP